jgi:hypothetical protein
MTNRRCIRKLLAVALAAALVNSASAAQFNSCSSVPGAAPGSFQVPFGGHAQTNIIAAVPTVDTLGFARIESADNQIRMTCGIRGTLTSVVPTLPPSPPGFTATFVSHAVCPDHSQLDFDVATVVSIVAACPDGVNTIGNVSEQGDITGSVGAVQGAVGRIQLNGVSACGLQELDISGFLCLTDAQYRALKQLKQGNDN